MIKRIQEVLYKETKSDEEKESIKHYFISKQQEVNENLIKEQNSIIESLQTKCHNYQNDLKNVGKIDGLDFKLFKYLNTGPSAKIDFLKI